MHTDWSREIRTHYANLDVRFDLPIRPLGQGKWFARGEAGLLYGWDTRELRWMATRLREALNVPARSANLGNRA